MSLKSTLETQPLLEKVLESNRSLQILGNFIITTLCLGIISFFILFLSWNGPCWPRLLKAGVEVSFCADTQKICSPIAQTETGSVVGVVLKVFSFPVTAVWVIPVFIHRTNVVLPNSKVVFWQSNNLIKKYLKSRTGRDFYAYYNVPYGLPPVGKLRFQPPLPAEAWSGVKDGTEIGPRCLQESDGEVKGVEDCLYVDIYTPKLPENSTEVPKLPVIVYIFGGGFNGGTGSTYKPNYFMDEDVIIVSIESRLGALGFLNSGDLAARGNQGLKDQVLALKWIQTNIHSFGGEPKKVVVMGSSSGAMCAHGHLLSPMSKGIFSGVVSISGTLINPGIIDQNTETKFRAFAESLGCEDHLNNSTKILLCLQNAPADEIAMFEADVRAGFRPSVEAIPEDGNLENTFLPDTPINLISSGRVNKVPWMVGVMSGEEVLQAYSIILDPASLDALNNNWTHYLPKILGLPRDDESNESTIGNIHDFYFRNLTLGKENSTETRTQLRNILNDRFWNHPAKVASLWHSQHSPAYRFYFTKESNVSIADSVMIYFDPPYGTSHGDSNQYTFIVGDRFPYIPLNSTDIDFSIMSVKLFVSFAETGVPDIAHSLGIKWPSVDPTGKDKSWFKWDDVPVIMEPFTERLNFWDSLPSHLLYNQSLTNSTAAQKRPGEIILVKDILP